MMESEQRIYLKNSKRRYVEINPAIIALQRLIVRQYEQFIQPEQVQQGQVMQGQVMQRSNGLTSNPAVPPTEQGF